jgi:hypothetical protein
MMATARMRSSASHCKLTIRRYPTKPRPAKPSSIIAHVGARAQRPGRFHQSWMSRPSGGQSSRRISVIGCRRCRRPARRCHHPGCTRRKTFRARLPLPGQRVGLGLAQGSCSRRNMTMVALERPDRASGHVKEVARVNHMALALRVVPCQPQGQLQLLGG